MSAPRISVVLPVYNGANTLGRAIRSLSCQTYGDFEILLLDDGSTDGSINMARRFPDGRLRIFHDGTNRGLAYRLNQGIDLALGQYIARMDQDDICFPERLAKQFEYLERSPDIDLIGCRAIAFNQDNEVIRLLPFRRTHEEICAQPWNGFYLVHPSWMGRAEWFRRHRYHLPEPFCAEDQELLLRAYPKSRFACIEEVLLAYRSQFRLKKSLRARHTLLAVQLSHFSRRGEWRNALYSVLLAISKSIVDVAISMPLMKSLLSRRTPRAPDEEIERFADFMREQGYAG